MNRLSNVRVLKAFGLVTVVALAAVVLFALGGYTPTTTAYVQNDTAESVTLDNCDDLPVTLAPGASEQLRPFEDATHAACPVFRGGSDLGIPIGCLHVSSSHGRTIAGAFVNVSAMRLTSRDFRCR